jgi:hypothetical protein
MKKYILILLTLFTLLSCGVKKEPKRYNYIELTQSNPKDSASLVKNSVISGVWLYKGKYVTLYKSKSGKEYILIKSKNGNFYKKYITTNVK